MARDVDGDAASAASAGFDEMDWFAERAELQACGGLGGAVSGVLTAGGAACWHFNVPSVPSVPHFYLDADSDDDSSDDEPRTQMRGASIDDDDLDDDDLSPATSCFSSALRSDYVCFGRGWVKKGVRGHC